MQHACTVRHTTSCMLCVSPSVSHPLNFLTCTFAWLLGPLPDCRDILNEGTLNAVAGGLPNSLQPFDYIPSSIGDRFNKDVAVLFGFDAVDK